ncbi:MAG TPA: DUF4190 domain-containing protein [Ktedonobacterales bacterium]
MASSPPSGAQVAHADVASGPSTPNLAQVSQILGILSCIPAVGILFCIPAIVCGHLSLRRARTDASEAQAADRTRALWGLALGYVIVVIYAWMALGLFVVPAISGR